jgi:hypothetical protein
VLGRTAITLLLHLGQCFAVTSDITHTLWQTTSTAESGLRQCRLSNHGRFGGTGS